MADDDRLALARFTVLDLTRARAGPTCVRQLVDWGARAIKIEMPGGRSGDGMGGTRHGFDFQASRWLMSGEIPPQAGNNHPTGIPTGVFETKDGHINIAASGDEIYARFCRAIERADLVTDPRFASPRARSSNRDLLMQTLMPVTRQKPSTEWIRILNDAGVPCGPIYRVDESFADPQVRHLEMAQPVHSEVLGDLTILGHPVSHGNRRRPIRTAAPELGQDSEEILASIGYTSEQIADLKQRGIV